MAAAPARASAINGLVTPVLSAAGMAALGGDGERGESGVRPPAEAVDEAVSDSERPARIE